MEEQKTTKECPECSGQKVIPGICECDSEWRGTQVDDEWNECQCTPDVPCPICNGTGVIEV